jgi:protein-disulfide isomerase
MTEFRALTRRRILTGTLATAALAAALPAFAAGRKVVEMSIGSPNAPVTLVEYASLTCPHCASFHTGVLPQIKAAFVDTGKVRVIYRDVYFDRPGLWGAMIARCAGPDRFFGVIDLLYRNQADWSRAADVQGVTRELFAIGRQAGMTDAQMQECLQDSAFAEALVAEYQKNATADGIDSTPSFLIDGRKVGNMPYADFERALNEALGS